MNISIHIAFTMWVGKGNKNYPDGWKTLPSKAEVWAEAFALNSKGGSKRGFLSNTADFQPYEKSKATISSPMEAGDEIREMLSRGSLSVWRRSDEYSTDFMAAASTNSRGGFFVTLRMTGNGAQDTATIQVNDAKIASFERAVKNGKNIETMHVSFSPTNAQCKYGRRAKSVLLSWAKAVSE